MSRMSRNIYYALDILRYVCVTRCIFHVVSLAQMQVLWSPSLPKVVGFQLVLTTENHERRLTETKTQAKCFFLTESFEKMM